MKIKASHDCTVYDQWKTALHYSSDVNCDRVWGNLCIFFVILAGD